MRTAENYRRSSRARAALWQSRRVDGHVTLSASDARRKTRAGPRHKLVRPEHRSCAAALAPTEEYRGGSEEASPLTLRTINCGGRLSAKLRTLELIHTGERERERDSTRQLRLITQVWLAGLIAGRNTNREVLPSALFSWRERECLPNRQTRALPSGDSRNLPGPTADDGTSWFAGAPSVIRCSSHAETCSPPSKPCGP
jgi:hypothetical protein